MGTKKETKSSDCRWVAFPGAKVNHLRRPLLMSRDLPPDMIPHLSPDRKITSGILPNM